MTDTQDLKPCPFCGADPYTEEGGTEGYYVSCPACLCVVGEAWGQSGGLGLFKTEAEAIAAWNRREP